MNMSGFTKEGDYPVKIVEATLAAPKFEKNYPCLDVALLCRAEDGTEDWWRGEVSQQAGMGNMANKTQYQITIERLESIGWAHGNNINEETLQSLVGVETVVGVKHWTSKDGTKSGYEVKYLGQGSFAPQKLSAEETKARMAAIFGGAAAAPQQGFATSPAPYAAPAPGGTAKPNPFGKKA
jgi:hypothetical protein